MKWKEKWKEKNKKREAKDIEFCKQHPTGWKAMVWLFAIGFLTFTVFMVVSGAYPLAIIAIVFAIWLNLEYIKIYRKAFPNGFHIHAQINQASRGLK